MASPVRRYLHARAGTAATEFCMIAPIMLILYGGVTEFGAIFKVYYQANRLATQYAMAWADCSDQPAGSCQSELGSYTTTAAIGNIAPALNPSSVTLQMFQFRMSGTTPVVASVNNTLYAYPSGTSMSGSQVAAAQAAGIPDGEVGVLVTVTYQHQLKFFQTLMNSYLASRLTPTYTVVQLKS